MSLLGRLTLGGKKLSSFSALIDRPGFLALLLGFGLFAITASLLVPQPGHNAAPSNLLARRHAQEIVHAFKSGRMMGLNWSGRLSTEKMASVAAGQAVNDGPFAGRFVGVSLTARSLAAAAAFIFLDANGDLAYDPSGSRH